MEGQKGNICMSKSVWTVKRRAISAYKSIFRMATLRSIAAF